MQLKEYMLAMTELETNPEAKAELERAAVFAAQAEVIFDEIEYY